MCGSIRPDDSDPHPPHRPRRPPPVSVSTLLHAGDRRAGTARETATATATEAPRSAAPAAAGPAAACQVTRSARRRSVSLRGNGCATRVRCCLCARSLARSAASPFSHSRRAGNAEMRGAPTSGSGHPVPLAENRSWAQLGGGAFDPCVAGEPRARGERARAPHLLSLIERSCSVLSASSCCGPAFSFLMKRHLVFRLACICSSGWYYEQFGSICSSLSVGVILPPLQYELVFLDF